MEVQTVDLLPSLYDQDETAWLDAMSDLARDGRVEDLDLIHLAEYLSDMARRDRREVESRLVVLLAHILKWVHQPDKRTRSWRATVVEPKQELNRLAGHGVLRQHAEQVLNEVYAQAIERVSAETGLPAETFPLECPYTIERLFTIELADENE